MAVPIRQSIGPQVNTTWVNVPYLPLHPSLVWDCHSIYPGKVGSRSRSNLGPGQNNASLSF